MGIGGESRMPAAERRNEEAADLGAGRRLSGAASQARSAAYGSILGGLGGLGEGRRWAGHSGLGSLAIRQS